MLVSSNLTYVKKLIQKNELVVKEGVVVEESKEGSINNKRYTKLLNKSTPVVTLSNSKDTALRKTTMFVSNGNDDSKPVLADIVAQVASVFVRLDTSNYFIPEANGLQNITLRVIAGQRLSMKLTSSDSEGGQGSIITDLVGLPASLYFNKMNSSIEGVPFILGTYELTANLQNKNKIMINLIVLPKDLY